MALALTLAVDAAESTVGAAVFEGVTDASSWFIENIGGIAFAGGIGAGLSQVKLGETPHMDIEDALTVVKRPVQDLTPKRPTKVSKSNTGISPFNRRPKRTYTVPLFPRRWHTSLLLEALRRSRTRPLVRRHAKSRKWSRRW